MNHAPSGLSGLPGDLHDSPLVNADLAPVPAERRTWTTYNYAALWMGMAHCLPTYMLAGGLVAQGMNWWQALLTIGLGNLIVLVPILLNAHPGTKYGLPFPVVVRSSFGTVGANVPALARAVVACGWFGIQTYLGGEAMKTFLVAVWPTFATVGGDATVMGLGVPSAICFGVFWLVNIGIIVAGMNALRFFENWAAPLLMVLALWLLIWLVRRAGDLGPTFDEPSKFESVGAFWKVFVPSLTGMIGFWATLSLNIPDFTRYGKGQRQQAWGQALGLPTTMIAFSAMAVVITSASQALLKGVPAAELWDPVKVLSYLTSPDAPPGMDAPIFADGGTRLLVALIALVAVGIATISTNIAANIVSPANDFANLAPKRISFRTGAVITGVIGILIMPWRLLSSSETYIFDWLVGYSALLGPIAGIMIADYWIVKRKRLVVEDLYRHAGRYGRVNPIAMLALAVGVAPNVPGFLGQVKVIEVGPLWSALYPYAWFTGLAIAGAVYVVGMRIRGHAADGKAV